MTMIKTVALTTSAALALSAVAPSAMEAHAVKKNLPSYYLDQKGNALINWYVLGTYNDSKKQGTFLDDYDYSLGEERPVYDDIYEDLYISFKKENGRLVATGPTEYLYRVNFNDYYLKNDLYTLESKPKAVRLHLKDGLAYSATKNGETLYTGSLGMFLPVRDPDDDSYYFVTYEFKKGEFIRTYSSYLYPTWKTTSALVKKSSKTITIPQTKNLKKPKANRFYVGAYYDNYYVQKGYLYDGDSGKKEMYAEIEPKSLTAAQEKLKTKYQIRRGLLYKRTSKATTLYTGTLALMPNFSNTLQQYVTLTVKKGRVQKIKINEYKVPTNKFTYRSF